LGLIIGCELDKCEVEVPVPTPVLEIIPALRVPTNLIALVVE
jgi:hypothetical protein